MSDIDKSVAKSASQPRGFPSTLIDINHEAYDGARRVWNGMIDRRPSCIARCSSAEEVRAAVKFARSEGLRVSIRGGGHSVAGNGVCEGGIMIDLSQMKEITVNPNKREAIASPGLLWGEFDAATQAYRLATTGGQVSHTGIAGLTLGGGLGYLMCQFGAACDNVLSLDVVTADGEMLTCSATRNPDLFWAMRGAGASFRYQLHPLDEILAGLLLHSVERAPELVSFYRDFIKGAPDELDTTLDFLYSSEGVPLVGVIAVYAGAPSTGERVLEPLRKFGPPIADLIRPMSYLEAQKMADALLPIGNRYYWKSSFASEVSDGLAEVLALGVKNMPSRRSMILMFQIGGQIRRVPREAMAFDQRDNSFELSIIANWTDPSRDTENIQCGREVWEGAQPYVLRAGYVNHMAADEPQERVLAAYGVQKYRRLAEIKRSYDPDNFFCLNQNIQPAPA